MWSAFTFSMALTKSSVLGFIVCPPPITISARYSLNISSIPLPGATVIMAYFLCSTGSSTTALASSNSTIWSCCCCMFSTLIFTKRPWRRPIFNATYGFKVCTCTLTKSSSCTQTKELPMLANSSRKPSSEKFFIPISFNWITNSVQKPYSSSPPSTFVWAWSSTASWSAFCTTVPFKADRKPSKITHKPFPPLSTTPTSAKTGSNSGVLFKDSLASSTIFWITSVQSLISSVTVYA